jgi:AbrB family looped-hinge helix DNA binding protein
METATVTSKGQLVIPVRLRRRYGIKAGTKIHFIERGSEIVLQPLTPAYIRSLRGILRDHSSITRELLEERARDKEREERKFEKLGSR